MNNRFAHLFKYVGTDKEGRKLYAVNEVINSRAKRLVVAEDDNGCLLVVSHNFPLKKGGHQLIWRNGTQILAHRYIWQLSRKREILKGYTINHLCDVPTCINPEHIYMGTPADNMLDKTAEGKRKRVIIFLDDEAAK